ncbi:MAG: thioredoxin family protein [Flavobacteriales bacterium]|nr:MAG: thioredoxin family protein [Flavobacteriales bacterium]PIE48697.1 MAG: thioredoxin family protein [Flavobacteriales bacterium]
MKKIIQESLNKSFTYKEYRTLVTDLLKQGKSTAPEQSEALLHYSKLNNSRMKRVDKTFKVSEKAKSQLKNLAGNYIWLVISEGWCGDAAQILPVINKMADASENIDLRIVLRDENEELMNNFLTNGGKSIPKLILLNADTLEVIDTWGPRPSTATKMVEEQKRKYGVLDDAFKEKLQQWYNADKGMTLEKDLLQLLDVAQLA